MGTFSAKVIIANPQARERRQQVELLVDTGATLSFIPAGILQALGIQPAMRGQAFETINGQVIQRDIGETCFMIDGRELVTPVVFADPDDRPVLGAVTLEALGFGVDPLRRQLIPRRYFAMFMTRPV